jgi:long-chain fatty acid transport protein
MDFVRNGLVPGIGMVWPMKGENTLGLGLYSPSGTRIDYPDSRNLLSRLLDVSRDRRLKFDQSRLILAWAHEFGSGWSLGVALHLGLNRLSTDHITLGLRTAAADTDWDHSASIGFGLGVYRQWRKFSVGAGYVSPQWARPFRKYSDLAQGAASLPQVIQAGFAWRPLRPLEIAIDYRYVRWSEASQYGAPVSDGGLYWRDQQVLKAGLEWKVDERVTLRCGISQGNTPIRDEAVFLSALTPVTAETNIAVGFSLALSDRTDFHGAFVHTVPSALRDRGWGNPISLLAGGSILSSRSDGITLGMTWKF